MSNVVRELFEWIEGLILDVCDKIATRVMAKYHAKQSPPPHEPYLKFSLSKHLRETYADLGSHVDVAKKDVDRAQALLKEEWDEAPSNTLPCAYNGGCQRPRNHSGPCVPGVKPNTQTWNDAHRTSPVMDVATLRRLIETYAQAREKTYVIERTQTAHTINMAREALSDASTALHAALDSITSIRT